jgi:hypothetical protein
VCQRGAGLAASGAAGAYLALPELPLDHAPAPTLQVRPERAPVVKLGSVPLPKLSVSIPKACAIDTSKWLFAPEAYLGSRVLHESFGGDGVDRPLASFGRAANHGIYPLLRPMRYNCDCRAGSRGVGR